MMLAIILSIVGGTMLGAMLYGRAQQKARNVEEWALGGRRMGTLIFWFLNAGEIYTTFAVLGISGFAWAYGAPAYLAFCSVSLSAAVGYWLTPRIHAYGRHFGLLTQADYFAQRYQAPWLGVLVGLAGIIALIVYIQIQITALTLIVELAAGHTVGKGAAAAISVIAMLLFVYLAGLRSAAFAAGVKDVLMLVLVVALCATVAAVVGQGSILDVFDAAQSRYPDLTRFPGLKPELGLGLSWFVTSAINVALGTWVFPHMFQLCYSAADGQTIKRNAIFQPIYSLSYFFIILLGFAALLAGTSAPGGDPNALLLQFVGNHYPAWMMGLLAGTASLLALVPGSVLLLTCGSIFGRNVLRPIRPAITDAQEFRWSRLSMIGFALAALWLTLGANASLVEIGLSAYAAIGMLAPGVFLGFASRRTSAAAVTIGMAGGYAILWIPALAKGASVLLPGWDMGIVAMAVNAALTLAFSIAFPHRERGIVAVSATTLSQAVH